MEGVFVSRVPCNVEKRGDESQDKAVSGSSLLASRVISILFACFISLFALDVFREGYGFWGTFVAFLMHMVPTCLVILVLVLAWRWEWVGGLLFAALGVFYMVSIWGRFPPSVYVTIAGPLFLISYLFFLNWRYKDKIRAQRSDSAE